MHNPITYNQQMYMDHFNMQPFEVKERYNIDTDFQKRFLYMLIYSRFKFGLPKDWAQNWFRFWLFHYGSIATIYTKEYGWIDYPYGIEKLGLYYQPKQILVTSPYLKETKRGVIGVNAEIIKICDDYYGLDDLVTRYATQLANIDKSINIALMNANVSMVFGAQNKKQGDTIKEAYGEATTGKPLVVVNKDVLGERGLEPFFPTGNFIVDKLLQAKRTVINEFLTKVGIQNANYDKKERLNSQEVTQNNDEVRSIISVIFENLKESFENVNKLSGLNLTVELVGEEAQTIGTNDIVWNDAI